MQKRRKFDRQTVINTLAVVFVICLFGYAFIQLSSGFSTDLSTQRTQVITDENYISLKGYIFRDEYTVCAEGPSVADYPFSNGEKISVGTAFAEVYPAAEGLLPETVSEGQAQINAILSQIEILKSSVSGGHRVADMQSVNSEIDRSYYEFINSVRAQSFSAADMSGENLLGAINDRLVITGKLDGADNIISSLEQRKEELFSLLAGGGAQTYTAEESCYFYRETDGYEKVFDYTRAMSMTAEELEDTVSKAVPETEVGVIGKKIINTKWYVLTVADISFSSTLEVGEKLDIAFESNNSKVITMTVERIAPSEDNGRAIIAFSSREMPADFDFARTQSMKILVSSYSGYRVPAEAVTECDGERGVYILSGNIVEFRRVTVIGHGDGYYIVNTYDGDDAEENLGDIPYLNVNDLIITSGGNLYDGKILD